MKVGVRWICGDCSDSSACSKCLRVMQAGRRQRFDLAGRKRHRHAVVEAHQLGQRVAGRHAVCVQPAQQQAQRLAALEALRRVQQLLDHAGVLSA